MGSRPRPSAFLSQTCWRTVPTIETIPEVDPNTGRQAIDPFTGEPVFRQRIFATFYRALEAGNRRETFENDYHHCIAGLKGEITKEYFWEFGYVYDEHKRVELLQGDARRSLVLDAIADGTFNPFLGVEAPKQGTLNGSSCDNVALIKVAGYVARNKFQRRDQLWDGKFGGQIFKDLPQGGFDFVAGFDFRHEELSQVPDPILLVNDQLGFSPSTLFYTQRDVAAAFVEISIPLVSSTMKIPGVYSCDFSSPGAPKDSTSTEPIPQTLPGMPRSTSKRTFRNSLCATLRFVIWHFAHRTAGRSARLMWILSSRRSSRNLISSSIRSGPAGQEMPFPRKVLRVAVRLP